MGNPAYSDGKYWTELLDGKVVAMSPRPAANHNIAAGNIYAIFRNFLRGKPCIAFADGMDVKLSEKDRVIPDVLVVCNKDIVKKAGVYGVPDLVVEVLSHSTAKYDRGYKFKLYERCGVKEYWLVNTDVRSIEVYLLKDDKMELDNVYSIFPDYEMEAMTDEEKADIIYEFKTSIFPELTISIEEVFEKVF